MKRKQSQISEDVGAGATMSTSTFLTSSSFSSPFLKKNACPILTCHDVNHWRALLGVYCQLIESIDVKVKDSGDKNFGFNHLETSLKEMDDYLFKDLFLELQQRRSVTQERGGTTKKELNPTDRLVSDSFVTKTELVKIIQWKMTRGKVRPYMKFILTNNDKTVRKISSEAFNIVDHINIDTSDKKKYIASLKRESTRVSMRKALEKLSCKEMKGLGPAGSSAVLAIYRPELFTFMADQLLELINGKREYEIVPYLNMNQRVIEIAISLDLQLSVEEIGKAIYVHEVLFRDELKLGPGKKLLNGEILRKTVLDSVKKSISTPVSTNETEVEKNVEDDVDPNTFSAKPEAGDAKERNKKKKKKC